MGQIHQLIAKEGVEAAKAIAPASLVDRAAAVMAAESGIGITYSGFCLTSLPHRKIPDADRWVRHGANVILTIDPGSLPDGKGASKVRGVPYGSRARMILLYLQTRAVQTGSAEIDLGGSMRDWLNRMGMPDGGKQYKDIRDQADRIAACTLTFQWRQGNGGYAWVKDSIVRGGFQIPCDDQPRLWSDKVQLSESFFSALRAHPVPVAEAALRQIGGDSAALDVYCWLAYRLHAIDGPTPISWAALHQQFGFSYARLRDFRREFQGVLAKALAVYPDAVVSADDAGVTLYPSRPPIPERSIGR